MLGNDADDTFAPGPAARELQADRRPRRGAHGLRSRDARSSGPAARLDAVLYDAETGTLTQRPAALRGCGGRGGRCDSLRRGLIRASSPGAPAEALEFAVAASALKTHRAR